MQAAVFRKTHEPLTIESVDIDKPWGREVLVRTAATGVCHSDLHVVDGQGRWPLDRPIVLGHEGAGVVEAVGPEVTTLRPGDHVVACLSGFCGSCPQCLSGHPNLCTAGAVTRPDSAAPRLSQQGAPLRQFIGISSYAERMLLHENSVVKIDADLPLDRAALVGCGVLTGVGAALRTSGLEAGRRRRSSAAAGSAWPSCRARASAAPARSSAWTSSTPSWRWPGVSAPRTW
jgi:S-(hydroxymethyl)glutathione dehydrogenase/alcohol dehydrogenase